MVHARCGFASAAALEKGSAACFLSPRSGGAGVKLAPFPLASSRIEAPRASYRGRGVLRGKLIVGPEFFEAAER